MWHDELKKHRLIKGNDAEVVARKALIQAQEWDDRWDVVDAREQERTARANDKRHQEDQKKLVVQRSADAQGEIDALANLLNAALEVNDAIDWGS